ncbi:unnamed protein product [Rotaria socialis]|uniref:Uncharacterized protein n=1 Tax=Rotaria socialis TaxID=392032 RepID=A0A821Y1B2_9BILA|nr:unnamed protein product [Rotaria socialis]
MAPEQWHLLGANQMFYNTRNIPLMELSDHYPVFGFFNLNEHQWPEKPSGTLTYVRIVTADTNLPVMMVDRNIRIGNSSNDSFAFYFNKQRYTASASMFKIRTVYYSN